jgi:uncharacterized protein YbbC (DUF1343 family)
MTHGMTVAELATLFNEEYMLPSNGKRNKAS